MRSRTIVLGIFIMGLTLLAAGAASAAPPTGLAWMMNANGFEGPFIITSIDAQGNLLGTFFGEPIFGFWDETAQKITFMRTPIPNNPQTFQIYTGFLFVSGPEVTYNLAGYFEAFAGTGATATRTLYGWFARLTLIP